MIKEYRSDWDKARDQWLVKVTYKSGVAPGKTKFNSEAEAQEFVEGVRKWEKDNATAVTVINLDED